MQSRTGAFFYKRFRVFHRICRCVATTTCPQCPADLSCAQSENPPFIELGDESQIYLEKVVDGIDIPWGISFIDEDEMLVTDKKGILFHVKDNIKTPVQGLPKIIENRQGGLLDIEVDKDFKKNKRIFFTTSNSSSNSKESNVASRLLSTE